MEQSPIDTQISQHKQDKKDEAIITLTRLVGQIHSGDIVGFSVTMLQKDGSGNTYFALLGGNMLHLLAAMEMGHERFTQAINATIAKMREAAIEGPAQ